MHSKVYSNKIDRKLCNHKIYKVYTNKIVKYTVLKGIVK